jgi:hypothetical protein
MKERAGARPARGLAGFDFASWLNAAEAGATLDELAAAQGGRRRRYGAGSRRTAEGFEALRDASDAALAREGRRPAIFLANMGRVAQHTARAMFAHNFFEAGGIEAITNAGFPDADAAADAFRASGARLAVICGSDPQYAESARLSPVRSRPPGPGGSTSPDGRAISNPRCGRPALTNSSSWVVMFSQPCAAR